MRKLMCAAFILVLISGCSEPTYDATTPETAKASAERMAKPLSPDEAKEFIRSVFRLSANAAFRKDPINPLHGLTVSQINAKAKALRESTPKDGGESLPARAGNP